MPRRIECPGCQASYNVPEDAAGKPMRVKCKKCDTVFTAGAAAPNGAVKAPTRAAPPSKTAVKAPPGTQPPAKGRPQKPLSVPDEDDEVESPRPRRKAPDRKPAKRGPALILLAIPVVLILVCGAAVGAYLVFAPGSSSSRQSASNTESTGLKDFVPPKDLPPLDRPVTDKPADKDGLPPDRPKPPPPIYTLKNPPKPPQTFKAPLTLHRVVFMPDGKTVVTANNDAFSDKRGLVLLDVATGAQTKSYLLPGCSLLSLALTPDGKSALVAGTVDFGTKGDPVNLVNLETGVVTPVLKGKVKSVGGAALSRDGSLLAVHESFPVNALRVLDMKTGEERFRQDRIYEGIMIRGLAFTADGKYLVSLGAASGKTIGKVTVWDLAARAEKRSYTADVGYAEDLALSADGKLMAAAFHDPIEGGSARVWDVETGAEKLAVVRKGGSGARHVVFGPGDSTLIASFYDHTTRLFDLRTGAEVGGVEQGDGKLANTLAVLPDGRTLWTGDYQEVSLWDLPDSLAVMPSNGKPFAQVFVDGKEIAGAQNDPGPKSETVGNAVVLGTTGNSQVRLSVGGQAREVFCDNTTKYFEGGKQLAAADGARVRRIGNTVMVKLKPDGKQAAEIHLVREGKGEWVAEKVEVTETRPKGLVFKGPMGNVGVTYAPNIKLFTADGKEVPSSDIRKYFDFNKFTYNLTLRAEVGSDEPVVVEARAFVKEITPPPPGNLVTLKGAKVGTIMEGKKIYKTLTPPGGTAFKVSTAGRDTKVYDKDGKELGPGQLYSVFKDNQLVDVVYDGKSFVLTEIRPAAGQ